MDQPVISPAFSGLIGLGHGLIQYLCFNLNLCVLIQSANINDESAYQSPGTILGTVSTAVRDEKGQTPLPAWALAGRRAQLKPGTSGGVCAQHKAGGEG